MNVCMPMSFDGIQHFSRHTVTTAGFTKNPEQSHANTLPWHIAVCPSIQVLLATVPLAVLQAQLPQVQRQAHTLIINQDHIQQG